MKRFWILIVFMVAYTVSEAVPIEPGFVDSSSPVLLYTGAWSTVIDADAAGGDLETTSNGAVEFDLFTTGLTLFAQTDIGSAVEVCIDADCTSLDLDGGGEFARADFTGLGSGQKSVTVTATAGTFAFDGVYVHPDELVAQPVDEYPGDTFEWGGVAYTTKFPMVVTAGDLTVIVLLAFLSSIQMANLVMWLWYRE